jgi:mono/diheme cytochrome c family protein
MAVIAFVAFWVLVALGLLFIAISGGPGGARERLQTQSRGGRKGAFLVFAVVLLAFGIAVPIATSLGVTERNSIPEADISNLSKQEERGRKLFSEYCRLCHTLEAAGSVATVGPDLDQLRPNKELVLDAVANGRARGNGAMARDLVVGQDAEDVATFVARAVGKDK